MQFYEYAVASGKAPEKLVIFLHGYGSNGMNLLPLSAEFSSIISDAHFVSPNAPFAFEGMGNDGFQWYSLGDRSEAVLFAQAKIAEVILNEFIDSQLKRFDLSDKDLVVMGFSQGGMMAMHTMYRRPHKCLGVVSFSGYMSGTTNLADDIKSKPPILLCHGTRDTVVPYQAMAIAAKTLRHVNVKVIEHSVERLGHSIDSNCINATADFLKSIQS